MFRVSTRTYLHIRARIDGFRLERADALGDERDTERCWIVGRLRNRRPGQQWGVVTGRALSLTS